MSKSNWFLIPQPRLKADLNLICFPFAGGNASTYLSWSKYLPANVELIAIQLPGRANRMFESNHFDMRSLITELLMVISIVTNRPYILFGHSLGCKIAFELMIQCKINGLRLPIHFIASGSSDPDILSRTEPIHHLPDVEFINKLEGLNGTPKEILKNDELMTLCLPSLRADFKLYETYVHFSNTVFDCPISVSTGDQDSDVSFTDLKNWENFFSYSMKLYRFPGDHFFIESDKHQILHRVNLIIKETFKIAMELV